MEEKGRCFRDRSQICILVDMEKGMFLDKKSERSTPMFVASNFLLLLLSYLSDIPGFQDTVEIYVGKQHLRAGSHGISCEFEKAYKEMKPEKQMYTFWTRKLRGNSMKAVRYIILTYRKIAVPHSIKNRTLVLDFDCMNEEAFVNVTHKSRYAHVPFENYVKAVAVVYYTNFIPYYFTCLSGAHHIVGTMYGRMFDTEAILKDREYDVMTVPEISIIGVGGAAKIAGFPCAGKGVFEVWSGSMKYGMQKYAESGIRSGYDGDGLFSSVPTNHMNAYMNALHETILAVNDRTDQVLYGHCKELNTSKNMIVLFRPSPDKFAPDTWRYSQTYIKEFDTCTTKAHGSINVNQNAEQSDGMENWFHGSSTVCVEFFYWDPCDLTPTEFFHPNVDAYVTGSCAFSGSIASNMNILREVVRYCYQSAKEKKQISKFFAHPFPRIDAYELKKTVEVLFNELREPSTSPESHRNILNQFLFP